jgi:sensor domain CHASE-containing protein
MSSGTKPLLILLMTMGTVIGFMHVASLLIFRSSGQHLEEAFLRDTVARARQAVHHDLAGLAEKASGWSSWHETCAFVQQPT